MDVLSMERAARALIAAVERGEAAVLWQAASAIVHERFEREAFVSTLVDSRRRLGAGEARRWLALRMEQVPEGRGMPVGQYLVFDYEIRLASDGRSCRETLTLRADAPGTWRLAGYMIRDAAQPVSGPPGHARPFAHSVGA